MQVKLVIREVNETTHSSFILFDYIARCKTETASIGNYCNVAFHFLHSDVTLIQSSLHRMQLGKIFLHLDLLLSKDWKCCKMSRINSDLNLTVCGVEPMISRKNKRIDLDSQSVSLNESLVHVLNKENQITLLLGNSKIASDLQQTLQVKTFLNIDENLVNGIWVALLNKGK